MARPLARISEFKNLEWLRLHQFAAPEPLAAGAFFAGGLPRWQFLITRQVEDTDSLQEFLNQGAGDVEPVLKELASEVARLHALGFIHRDLFPRNILVRRVPEPGSLYFLDAWRGGARLQGRGVAYDLACLLSSLREWLTTEQLDAWLASYSAQRTEHGRPVNPDRLVRRVLKERTALRKRYIRRGRGGELPDV